MLYFSCFMNFVLYVCCMNMLYACFILLLFCPCCMKFSFFNFFFSTFLKLKAKHVLLDAIIFLRNLNSPIKYEEHYLYRPVLYNFWQYFDTKLYFFNILFSSFFKTGSSAVSFFNFLYYIYFQSLDLWYECYIKRVV